MSLRASRNLLAAVQVAIDSTRTHLGQYAAVRAAIDSTSPRLGQYAAVRAAIDSTSTHLGQYAAVQVHSCYWQQQHAVAHCCCAGSPWSTCPCLPQRDLSSSTVVA